MKYLWSFCIVLLTMTSCSRKNEQQLVQEARDAEQQKNFPIAVERYAELVDRFTTTSLAETCQYRIAIIENNELRNTRGAVSAYLKFHDLYPNSTNAPTSLFLAGFLMNNEIHNIDSAKMFYERFVRQYPTHELAASAKYELESLGKDPGDLLRKNVTTDTSPADQKSEKARQQ